MTGQPRLPGFDPPVSNVIRETAAAALAAEQPLARLQRAGVLALSASELLGVVLGETGSQDLGRRLLHRFGGLRGLARASIAELCSESGIGPSRAARIRSLLELARRLVSEGPEERLSIRSPADVANLLMLEMSLLDQEQIRVILLNTKNAVLGVHLAYQGTLNTTTVRVSELFREAIRQNAAAVIVVHQHPSGDPTPSPEDVAVTRDIVQAGQMLGIDVLDHVVIGEGRYVSLKERGLGF